MKTFTLVVCTILLSAKTFSQCPASITASATTTAASCPSNGTAVITTNPAANSSFFYSIISAPDGVALNVPQSSNTFNALLPGNYTVKVTCGVAEATVSFTIGDAYTPLNVDATATANCGTFTPGGTINITATGGSGSLVYSIVKSNDPNYSDALSVYTSSTTKTVTSYGIYQVRVKDACNQFYTKTIAVNSALKPVEAHVISIDNDGCGTNTVTIDVYLFDPLSQSYGDLDDYESYGGIKIRIWEQAAGAGCGPGGSMVYETVLSSGSMISGVPIVPSKKYYIQTITACGDTSGYCSDATSSFTPAHYAKAITKGCTGSASNPPTMALTDMGHTYMIYPIQFTIKNSAGVTVFTHTQPDAADTYLTPDLPFDDYTITAVDACGNTAVYTVANPSVAGSASYSFFLYELNSCLGEGTTQNGTTSAWLGLNGYQEDLANAVITIISGPSNVGMQAIPSGPDWVWPNMLPGTYVIRVSTTCSSHDYTVVASPDNDHLRRKTIVATAASLCGGGGSVNSTVDFNSNGQNAFYLVNAATNGIIASNLTGNFSTVSAGSYFVRMESIACNGSSVFLNSNTVTLASGSGPQIVKKMGVTCEDAGGAPLTTGNAYLSFAGASPLLVEYKLTSSSSWVTYSANSPTEIVIPGLNSGSIYDIRVTSCGITAASQVTIEQMGTIQVLAPTQPCNNQSYELKLPQLSGASYEWKNAAGIIVSTNYNYEISNYNNSYNGQYTGSMTWGGCLNRTATITINSALCGNIIVLPLKLPSFNVKAENCTAMITWKTAGETAPQQFVIERSADGKQFSPVGEIYSSSQSKFNSYFDNRPLQGLSYYRLKITGEDGSIVYSKIVALSMQCDGVSSGWYLFPSLVQAGTNITVALNATEQLKTAKLIITNTAGQKVLDRDIILTHSKGNYSIPSTDFTSGTYVVSIRDEYSLPLGESKKFVVIR